MGTLYVVRHGQASLFSDDYDRLSDLGRRQARTLAEHWLQQGLRFDTAWSGDLKRQVDTAAGIAEAYAQAGCSFPTLRRTASFNEYPADDIMASLGSALRRRDERVAELFRAVEASAENRDRYRHFHRLLEAVIAAWVRGEHEPDEVPVAWQDWSAHIRAGLVEVLSEARKGASIVLFTSGGVIGVTVRTVLESPPIKAAELNWRIYNGSVTRYTFSGDRISLDHFNDISHLPDDQLSYR